jgi:aspartyl-tRNA(Asn)/glutamyl-tRNA(Gln) amidotransferase subunit B
MMNGAEAYEPVIGLEVHAQLSTESKMFCACSARYSGAPPNTHCCAVCAGMPGALPVINGQALEWGILSALALNCQVAETSRFDRKNYSYPDVPKGYQISQYDAPIGRGGHLEFQVGDRRVTWGITRLHLEEDTGKTTHTAIGGREVSLVDYNRSGVPLMEIVTEPETHTPEEAREFFAALRQILMYLGVNDGNLQEGSMRADVNISLRRPGGELGPKVEIKNLNSFRAVQRALEFEIMRQADELEAGKPIEQETRGWSEREDRTVPQRTKEYAHDYRYFPEPDLPPLVVSGRRVESLRAQLPELPLARADRLVESYGLTPYQAQVLTLERPMADYYERSSAGGTGVSPVGVANWITGDFAHLINDRGVDISAVHVRPGDVGALVGMVERREITGAAGKQVLEEMFRTGESPADIVDRLDLRQVGDEAALESLADKVLTENPALVQTYKSGKLNAIQAMVGRAMAESKGKANPQRMREILEAKLS